VDSFTSRRIVTTTNDQAQLGRLTMIVDAYRALEHLGRHPRIDPARIVVVGFSRGGVAALYSSLSRFQRMHGSTTGPVFAAHIAFYPDCRTTYMRDDVLVAQKPVRILHGTADNYNPVDSCRAYVTRLKPLGSDIQLVEFPGAHHVFDWPTLKVPQTLADAQTTRRCRLEEVSGGRIFNADTKQPFTYTDACVERGPVVAYDAKAHLQAQEAMRDIINSTLLRK
jgi:dienelactone hydrolase